jgi:hypothetical protein
MKDLLELEIELELALRVRLADSYRRMEHVRRHTENPLLSAQQRLIAMDSLSAVESACDMLQQLWEVRLALIDRLSTDPLVRTRVPAVIDKTRLGSFHKRPK